MVKSVKNKAHNDAWLNEGVNWRQENVPTSHSGCKHAVLSLSGWTHPAQTANLLVRRRDRALLVWNSSYVQWNYADRTITCAAMINGIRLAWLNGATPELVSWCVDNEKLRKDFVSRFQMFVGWVVYFFYFSRKGSFFPDCWAPNSVKCCFLVLHHSKFLSPNECFYVSNPAVHMGCT